MRCHSIGRIVKHLSLANCYFAQGFPSCYDSALHNLGGLTGVVRKNSVDGFQRLM